MSKSGTVVEQVLNQKIVNDIDKTIRSYDEKINILSSGKKKDVDFLWSKNKNQPYELVYTVKDKTIKVHCYVSSVSYLGIPHPKYKKRMQLSLSADKSYLKKVNITEEIVLLLGLYVYDESNPIIVAWDVKDNRKAGKSKSSHVYVNDILYAMKNGVLQRADKYKNNVYCFKPEYFTEFIEYNSEYPNFDISFINYLKIKGYAAKEYLFFDDIFNFISKKKTANTITWDGKECIKEMKKNDYSKWKETEWQGFYFEYLMEKLFNYDDFAALEKTKKVLEIPGPKYGKTRFDSFYNIPWDFKVHSNRTRKVPANDFESVRKGIEEYGKVGFIIICGDAEIEMDKEFSEWRNSFKGGLSQYQLKNINMEKKHRKLKASFKPKELLAIVIDENNICRHGEFQKDMINSNDNLRNNKLEINLDNISEEDVIAHYLFTDENN